MSWTVPPDPLYSWIFPSAPTGTMTRLGMFCPAWSVWFEVACWGGREGLTGMYPAAAGYLTVWPSGTPQQETSNLNFQAGQNIPNLVIVPVGADGKIQLYNGSGGTVQLIADVAGYILGGTPTAPGAVAPLPPARILDTRIGQGASGPVPSMG